MELSERPVASASSSCVARAPERRLQLPRGRAQLVAPLVDVRRHADRARLARDRALHRLANPPGRVGRELEALPVVELLDRPVQADDAVLDQIAERDAAAAIALRDRDDEPEIRVDHALLRRLVAALDGLGEDDLLGRGQQRVPPDLVQEEVEGVRRARQLEGLELAELEVLVGDGRSRLVGLDEVPLLVLEQRLHIRGIHDRLDR